MKYPTSNQRLFWGSELYPPLPRCRQYSLVLHSLHRQTPAFHRLIFLYAWLSRLVLESQHNLHLTTNPYHAFIPALNLAITGRDFPRGKLKQARENCLCFILSKGMGILTKHWLVTKLVTTDCSLVTVFVAMGNIITILSSNCPFTKSFHENSRYT